MKYGLMYYKETDNIGDDIQTYVAMKYLPHIDYYIDREDLSCFMPKTKEQVALIMNGWFIHNKLAWPPSPYIKPLLISMHFKNLIETDVGDLYLKSYGGDYLKKYQPVGARDMETLKRLRNNNIEAYFSGCMTLTLRKFHGIRKIDKICLVDLEEKIIEKIKLNTDSNIEILTHNLDQEQTAKRTIQDRMNDVESLLKKYQESKLVITTRLHVALPCLALGTPVIVLHKKKFDEDRLETYFNYVTNYVDEDFLSMDIKEVLKNPPKNNNEYKKIAKNLDKICKSFIKNCIEDCELPELKKYKEYASRLEWYKQIYERERLIVEKIENKRIQEYEIYHKNLEELNKRIEQDNNG